MSISSRKEFLAVRKKEKDDLLADYPEEVSLTHQSIPYTITQTHIASSSQALYYTIHNDWLRFPLQDSSNTPTLLEIEPKTWRSRTVTQHNDHITETPNTNSELSQKIVKKIIQWMIKKSFLRMEE